ncbi:MAG: DUF4926 domain-containing protein [Anaerolineae bacterium]|jgi:hypothetical protein
MEELDYVVLTQDLPEHRLYAGDVGMVLHVRGAQQGYEVEFVTLKGDLLALVALSPDQVRAIAEDEVVHARRMPPV